MRTAQGVRISFALSAPTDVEVAILDEKGRVVRHLAAGLLGGKNPPPPPLKPGLKQELLWNGTDDASRKVNSGRLKVRVRAGMQVKFGRIIGASPYTGRVTARGASQGVAVDEKGNLYVKLASFVGGLHHRIPWQVRLFDRRGRYLKTILPYPPSADPAGVPGFKLIDAGDGLLTPASDSALDPVLYFFGDSILPRTVDGSLVFVDGRNAVLRFVKPGGSNAVRTVPMRTARDKLKFPYWLTPQVAFSPDGRYAYYSNVAGTPYDGKKPSDIDPDFPQGRIYRQDISRPGTNPEPFFDLTLPDWEKTRYWMPSAWDKKTAAAGIDVDPKGNLFVCDLVNQEIVEVSPEGKALNHYKVSWPDKVLVSRKTGTLYVISQKVSRGYPPPAALVKLVVEEGRAREAARLALPGRRRYSFAVDESGQNTLIWVAGGDLLLRVEDQGDKLSPSGPSILNRDRNAVTFVAYLAADPEADLVYVTQGMGKVWRYDGETGKGGLIPIKACDLAVGPGGMIYTWGVTGSYKGPIGQYTRNLKPAPLESTGKHTFGRLSGRYGRGNSVCGMDVDLQGRVYAVNGANECHVRVYDADGNLVTYSRKARTDWAKNPEEVPAAVTGISGRGGSIRVDAAGNIYILQHGLPKGFKPPGGFEKDPAYLKTTGTIYKFGPEGGEFQGKGWSNRKPVGALAAYPGCGPISGAWHSTGSVCVCQKPRFDVDPFGRLYIPNAVTFKVTVVDNAGNPIVRFGGYGNFDARGPESAEPKPEIPLGWPTSVAVSEHFIFVGDMLNHRVVRVDPVYAAEAVLPVE